jgi:hypothetical protein
MEKEVFVVEGGIWRGTRGSGSKWHGAGYNYQITRLPTGRLR